MRCCSTTGVSIKGLAFGGASVLVVISLLGAVLRLNSGPPPADSARWPAKSGRVAEHRETAAASALDAAKSAPDEEAAAAPATRIHPVRSAPEGHSPSGRDARRTSPRAAGLDRPDQKSLHGSDRKAALRRALLETAGKIAVYDKEPWKDLLLVALAYRRTGNSHAMRKWFDRAIRLAADPDDPRHTSSALRDVVKALLIAREEHWARELVRRIPDPALRGAARADLVRALASRQRFQEAMRISATVRDERARSQALLSIAEMQSRFGNLAKAIGAALQIRNSSRQDAALQKVALARGSQGDNTGAERALQFVRNHGVRDKTRLKLTEMQARSGRTSPDTLMALFNDPFLRDQSLRRLVELEVRKKNLEGARTALFRITSRDERARAMEALVALQVRNGDLRGALSRAQSIRVEESRYRAIETVAVAEVGVKGAPAARSVASLITDLDQRDRTFRRVAERAAAIGRDHEAVDTILDIASPKESASALATVAKLRARRGAYGPARLLLEEARRHLEEIPERGGKERTLGLLAEAYAETRDTSAALQAAAGIENAAVRDRTYQTLSRLFASFPDVQLAEESAYAIQKEQTRERALDTVARTVAARTRATEALGRSRDFMARRQQVRFLVAVAQRI